MANPKSTVAPIPPTIAFIDATHSKCSHVQFGLYDGAFDGSFALLNSDSDETENFVGSDSRRFFVRITDASAATKTAGGLRRRMAAFRTYHGDKQTILDDGGGDARIVLVETAAGSGVFESSWLMTVSDPWETLHVKTTTGRAGLGLRSHGQQDYRLRLSSMFGYVGIEYPPSPTKSRSGSATAYVPMFDRTPDERRNLPVQIFVLKSAYVAGFEDYILGKDLENMRIVYARLGIWIWTVVDPAQRNMPGVLSKKVGKEELLVVPEPLGVVDASNPSDADCRLIGKAYPGLMADGSSGGTPSVGGLLTDTIRIFYASSLARSVGGTNQRINGLTYPDWSFSTDPACGASFVADGGGKIASGIGSAAAHEIGHSLASHRSDHFVARTPMGRFYPPCNLMADGGVASGTGVASSQRLWDVADGSGFNQWHTMRYCHYTRS